MVKFAATAFLSLLAFQANAYQLLLCISSNTPHFNVIMVNLDQKTATISDAFGVTHEGTVIAVLQRDGGGTTYNLDFEFNYKNQEQRADVVLFTNDGETFRTFGGIYSKDAAGQRMTDVDMGNYPIGCSVGDDNPNKEKN